MDRAVQDTERATWRQGKGNQGFQPMEVVAADADPIRMQFLASLLRDAGIEAVLLDRNLSGLGLSIFPQRLAVRAEDAARAQRLLKEAGV
jgi:hypothetical protein